jgi:hypothetical protein
MIRKKKWNPERKQAAIEAMRNKEKGSYKAFQSFQLTTNNTSTLRY